MTQSSSIKIVTPVGMLGYGVNEQELFEAIDQGASAIIVDSGSTDSGPQKLGLGHMTCPRESYVRDLKPFVEAAFHRKVKVIIGSAGGGGTNAHVDDLVSMVNDYAKEKDYKLKVVRIYAEIPKEDIHASLDEGKVDPCGSVPPPLTHEDIDASTTIVAQMGMEPFIEAMKANPDYDIIIAGRAYDPSPYAAYCHYNGFKNMGVIYNMGKVMECGGLCLSPKSKTAFAEIWQDRFEISGIAEGVVCTAESLAAHTLYEKTRPDLLAGPGGVLDLRDAEFYAHNDAAVGKGAKFIPEKEYTIKLEGAKVAGYKTMFVGSIIDPILNSNIDTFVQQIKQYVKQVFKGKEYELIIDVSKSTFGLPEILEVPGIECQTSHIVGQVLSKSQELSNQVASMTRIALVHGPYPGQKATSGNFAMPIIPLEVPLGVHCEFNVYHLMKVADPVHYFKFESEVVSPDSKVEKNPEYRPVKDEQTDGFKLPSGKLPEGLKSKLSPDKIAPEDPKFVFLHSLAKVIRSKNAGPYEVTFDVIFNDEKTFEWVRDLEILTTEYISKLYNIEVKEIIALLFFKQSKSFKFTIPRAQCSGSFRDTDLHGSQQHVPLMFVQIPAPPKN